MGTIGGSKDVFNEVGEILEDVFIDLLKIVALDGGLDLLLDVFPALGPNFDHHELVSVESLCDRMESHQGFHHLDSIERRIELVVLEESIGHVVFDDPIVRERHDEIFEKLALLHQLDFRFPVRSQWVRAFGVQDFENILLAMLEFRTKDVIAE